MGQGLELLATRRLNTVLDELQAITVVPQELTFLNRAAERDATDGELIGRFRGDVLISDIIAADSVAITKNADVWRTETFNIPKIKHGVRINEEMVNTFTLLEAGAGREIERLTLRGYIAQKLGDIVLGIRQRKNMILAAMHLDDFDYAMGGVIISNATWGMPSDLKFDPAIDWTTANAATMTPITDITTALRYANETYGVKNFNRITMSMTVLDAILGSTEFRNKALLFFQLAAFPSGSFPLLNEVGTQVSLLTAMLNSGGYNFQIVIEDSQYKDQLPDGSIARGRYWPENKVLIDSTASDNNPSDYFLGKAIVPETVVGSIATPPGVQGGFPGPSRGPVSWSEIPSLNPPNINLWGVDKAWPVRQKIETEILLTVF